MNDVQTRSTWPVVLAGMAAMFLVPVLIVFPLVAGGPGADNPTPLRATAPVVATSVAAGDRVTPPTAAHPPRTANRLDAHQAMLEQMRVNVTPEMIQAMNANPLAHPSYDLAELEQHAADINKMLALTP